MYNISTNCWTIVPATTTWVSRTLYRIDRAVTNRVQHWLAPCDHDPSYILCFDFRNHQFRKLEALVCAYPEGISQHNDSLVYYAYFPKPRGPEEFFGYGIKIDGSKLTMLVIAGQVSMAFGRMELKFLDLIDPNFRLASY